MSHPGAPFRRPPDHLSRCKRRRFLQLAGALGASAGAALLLPRLPTVRAAAPPLYIGAMGPFSGPSQATGEAIRQGVTMALEDAQAEGEVPVVIDGSLRDIEIVWVDSQSDPDRAVSAVVEAITRHNVQMMLGGWHSSVALAVMDAEVPFHILHLGHLGEAPAIAHKINRAPGKYRGWFKGWPSPSKLATLYGEPLEYFRDQGLWRPANNLAAVLVEDSEYGHSWGEALTGSLQNAGFEVPPYDLAALHEPNYGELLKRYQAQRVSLVAMTHTGEEATASFVRQFRQQGTQALLLAHGLRWFSNWYQLTGDASDFVISMDSAVPIALWQQWWVRRFQARFQQYPSIAPAGLHYDYTRLAIRLLNTAASLDLATLTRTLYRLPYKGIWNRYQFPSKPVAQTLSGNEVVTGKFMQGFFFPMVQLFRGEARIIWPRQYVNRRFRQPPWI